MNLIEFNQATDGWLAIVAVCLIVYVIAWAIDVAKK